MPKRQSPSVIQLLQVCADAYLHNSRRFINSNHALTFRAFRTLLPPDTTIPCLYCSNWIELHNLPTNLPNYICQPCLQEHQTKTTP